MTAARSMLETACKVVLDELDVRRDDTWDLPKLYHETAANLGIAPTQNTDPLFKSVFGASDDCHSCRRDAKTSSATLMARPIWIVLCRDSMLSWQ